MNCNLSEDAYENLHPGEPQSLVDALIDHLQSQKSVPLTSEDFDEAFMEIVKGMHQSLSGVLSSDDSPE